MAERTHLMEGLRPVTERDTDLLLALFDDLPDRDRTFLRGRLDREAVAGWHRDTASSRWLVETDGAASAYLGVTPLAGWSSHVGDLRLVVGADHRRLGLGRRLARHGLLEGVRLGLRKITVEVAAAKAGDIEMFTSIGFRPEALLEDHVLDQDGVTHDLVVLAHDVLQVRADLATIGADDAVGIG